MSDDEINTDFSVFPNPFNQTAVFRFGSGEVVYAGTSFIIYDLTGKEVKRIDNISTYEFIIDMTGYSAGMYHYHYIQGSSLIASGKFVISQ